MHRQWLSGCTPRAADLRDSVQRDLQWRRKLPRADIGQVQGQSEGQAREVQAGLREEARQVREAAKAQAAGSEVRSLEAGEQMMIPRSAHSVRLAVLAAWVALAACVGLCAF